MLEETDNLGKTPLHNAIQNGNIAATRILIMKGANIDAADRSGKTPLEYCSSDKLKAELQKILLGKKLKISLQFISTSLLIFFFRKRKKRWRREQTNIGCYSQRRCD